MSIATYVAYKNFAEQVGLGTMNLNTDTLKIALHTGTYTPNTTTDITQSALGNEVANGNGYTTGGEDVQNVWTESPAGTGLLDGTDVIFTATGTISNIRYAVLYNSSIATNNLIAYWDHGTEVSMISGETFTITFNASGILTIASP